MMFLAAGLDQKVLVQAIRSGGALAALKQAAGLHLSRLQVAARMFVLAKLQDGMTLHGGAAAQFQNADRIVQRALAAEKLLNTVTALTGTQNGIHLFLKVKSSQQQQVIHALALLVLQARLHPSPH